MKIALVARGIYPYDFGGREIRIYQLAKNFSQDHKVTVFVPEKENRDYPKRHEGFKICPVPFYPKNPKLLNSIGGISFARNVSGILSQKGFDVVDALFYSRPFDSGKTKVIATLNVVLPAWKHVPLRRKIYTLPVCFISMMFNFEKAHFADKVICVSDGAKREAESMGISDRKIKVVKNGVDCSLFNPDLKSKVREKYDIGKGTFLILYAGRLVEVKGVQDLIEAFNRLKEEDFDAKLMIVGEGKYESELKEMAPKEDVLFLGSQPYEKMPEFYVAADLFVLPSYWEVQPLGCIEAMACGVPVVATNVGGIPEEVDYEKTGLLISPGDITELENAIRRLHDDSQLRKSLLKNGLDFAKERTWQRIAETTLEVYKS